MSCWTANRRGVALVAKAIKKLTRAPTSSSAAPRDAPRAEMLAPPRPIDTVALGEADSPSSSCSTSSLERTAPLAGIAGTMYRDGEGRAMLEGPPARLDRGPRHLASPHDYFDTHILMTSRGCPWACTFCGAETTWGRGFRSQSWTTCSTPSSARRAAPGEDRPDQGRHLHHQQEARHRALPGIRERGLSFFWSCDTRVDLLTDELLREMRLAGCQRLSLGVESRLAAHPRRHRQEDHGGRDHRSTEMAKKVRHQGPLLHDARQPRRDGRDVQARRSPSSSARARTSTSSPASHLPRHARLPRRREGGLARARGLLRGHFQELKTPFDAEREPTCASS
jgi:anaerobic magnesium-protoporphyrin IX monomethyl ester cyclase